MTETNEIREEISTNVASEQTSPYLLLLLMKTSSVVLVVQVYEVVVSAVIVVKRNQRVEELTVFILPPSQRPSLFEWKEKNSVSVLSPLKKKCAE